jgi:Cache domain
MMRPPAGAAPAGDQLAPGDQFARLLAGVTRPLERVLDSVITVGAAAAAIAAAARSAGRPLRRADLAALRDEAAAVLRRHAGLAAGAGVVLAPGTLADAPLCIEWWRADEGAGCQRLQVDLDPGSAEFFDYTTTEWYGTPRQTGRPSVAGPYVDYICTHQYTFTVSVPIMAAGRFAGVAGADILAGQVERLALDGLSALGRPAVLVGGNGRVIASNTARVLPGVPAARQPLCAGLTPVAGPGLDHMLPWTLLSQPG